MKKPKSADTARKRILDDHRKIAQLTGTLATCADPEAAGTCVRQLLPVLQRHFAEEENEIDGLHADILERSPELQRALRGLAEEHAALLALAAKLATASQQGKTDLRPLGKQLQEQLAAHEAKEVAIFLDSIWVDSGQGD